MNFNLNEEIREGHLVSTDIKKVWAVELDLLKKFLEYCQAHKLKCWVEGGTNFGDYITPPLVAKQR